MTFPNSGAISIDAFVSHVDDPGITTAGDSQPHSMSEFYRKTDGPVYDLETTENDDIPASGTISFSQLRGTRAVVTRAVTGGIFQNSSNQYGHVLDYYFNSAERANKACRLVVDRDIFPGQNIANANTSSVTAIPDSSQPTASDFPHGLYLQFPQNSNGNNTNYIGGAHGAHGSPGTFSFSSSSVANNPNAGGTGGPGFVAACKVYVNPGSLKPNDNTESCFRGGGGGGGGGAIYNRGNLGQIGRWNNPNPGKPLRYRLGNDTNPVGNAIYNSTGNGPSNTGWNFTWNFESVSDYREGNVAQYSSLSPSGNYGNYATPSGAPSGGLRGHGYPGYDGQNNANWAPNNPPNSGSAGQIQIWNSGNPINDIYNTAKGGTLGTSGHSSPWAHFPYGTTIKYFSNSANVGLGSNHPNVTMFALGVSINYGYPIVKILYRYTNSSQPGFWYHRANFFGGQHDTLVGSHFHVLNPAEASNPGTMYQSPTVVNANNTDLKGTIRPAASGGSNGVQFNTAGNGAINSGDVTSVE